MSRLIRRRSKPTRYWECSNGLLSTGTLGYWSNYLPPTSDPILNTVLLSGILTGRKTLRSSRRSNAELVPALRALNYESRLVNLGLTTLDARRDRGDLIQSYKILKGNNNVIWHCGIQTATSLNLGGPCNGIRG